MKLMQIVVYIEGNVSLLVNKWFWKEMLHCENKTSN